MQLHNSRSHIAYGQWRTALAAIVGGLLLTACNRLIRNDNAGAAFGKCAGGHTPDSGGAAGNEDYFAVKRFGHKLAAVIALRAQRLPPVGFKLWLELLLIHALLKVVRETT